MSIENGRATFSLRLPQALADQIDKRAVVNRRQRNAEIILLLETAIDLGVQRDKEIMRQTREAQDAATLKT